MKLVITGAKGLIGSFTTEYARKQADVDVHGVDTVGVGVSAEKYLRADLTDYGQTVAALAGADAVIHLAAIRDSKMFPPAETFATNANSTFNVLQAAVHLRIPRVVLASTVQVARTVYMQNDTRYRYLPIDEDHEIDPQTDYALSKQVNEVCAEMFARHWGLSVVSLRFTAITHPDVIAAQFPWKEAFDPHWALYAYCDVRDAARCAYLAATASLAPNKHHIAYVVAKDTMVNTPSAEIASRFFPDATDRGLQGYDSLISGRRAEELFGFTAEYGCRKK
jgi:nucleoside-diphosphate-sugar epimerase